MPMIWMILIIFILFIFVLNDKTSLFNVLTGALAALIVSLETYNIMQQISIFIITAVCFTVFQKLFRKKCIRRKISRKKLIHLNGIIGFTKTCIPAGRPGYIRIKGQICRAVSEKNTLIPEGEGVFITGMKGRNLIVRKFTG
jgi:membrane protein implicated in regulation of membrane protease activity